MLPATQIRKFRWSDLDQLTQLYNEVSCLAGSEKAYDAELLRQLLSQPSRDPEQDCHVVESATALIAFALVASESRIGRAVASGGVLRPHRGRGIGRELLRCAVNRAVALKSAVLHVQASADSTDARHVLESEGFQTVRRYWQMRWQGDKAPQTRLPRGFSLRAFQLGQDEEALTQLQNAAFGGSWGFCPNTVEEISYRVRMKRCDPEGIVFVADGGRLAAYNWTLRTSSQSGATGWIAMTGVHPDYRGRGLGRAAAVAGMDYLNAKGVDAIELEVDSSNSPASQLYLKLGFRKLAETVWYEKRLTG